MCRCCRTFDTAIDIRLLPQGNRNGPTMVPGTRTINASSGIRVKAPTRSAVACFVCLAVALAIAYAPVPGI
jgi:hypothetical protein